MLKKYKFLLGLVGTWMTALAFANLTVPMKLTVANGEGEVVGTMTISETKYGLLFSPNLHGLTPGAHGFHVHQHPSCAQDGMAAGGHFDPTNTGKHLGPYTNQGHLGDLPVLYVNADGTVTVPVLAPRIRHIKDLNHHALMVHHAGDNYADQPEKLGGGGARMICGVIDLTS